MRPGGHGAAGELVGSFDAADRIGAIERNGLFGIFGTLDTPPDGTPVETAPASDVRTGSATILSTVAGDTVQAYTVNITRVYHDGASTRFAITVTDPALLAATGGIVQGMTQPHPAGRQTHRRGDARAAGRSRQGLRREH